MNDTEKNKALVLEQLRKTPIVQVVCEKTNISRMTFYRWKKDDKEFAKSVDEAMLDGQFMVNDLAESQLVSAVKDRNLSAIMYWLKHHHPDYATTIEVKHALADENLTPEQEAIVREALRLAMPGRIEPTAEAVAQNHESQEHHSPRTGGHDDEGQKSPRGDH